MNAIYIEARLDTQIRPYHLRNSNVPLIFGVYGSDFLFGRLILVELDSPTVDRHLP
jgi:hypothetical protein